MERVTLTHPSGSRAEVHLHGAHVTSWRTADGVERLFLSRAARFAEGSAIRGGIPVIFPQFADRGRFGRHGFARTLPWRCAGGSAGGAREALFELEDSVQTRALWPFAFRLGLRVTLEERALAIELTVINRDGSPFEFTAALHSYLRVADVASARVIGLLGTRFESGVEGVRDVVEREAEVRFGGELDRVYFDIGRPLELRGASANEVVELRNAGFPDVVLWNPGSEKARGLADLGAGEEREFVCVEAAVVGRPVALQPGARWTGAQFLLAR